MLPGKLVPARSPISHLDLGRAPRARCGASPRPGAARPFSSTGFRIGLRSDVHVDAGAQERSNRFQVAGARGKVQRGKSQFRMRLEIRPRLDERLKHLRMLFRGGPHQRRLMLRRLFGVHVGATNEQRANGVGGTGSGARHQRCFARRDRRVRICPRFQEQIHEPGASVGARLRERRHAKVVGRVRIGTGTDEQLRRLEIVPMRGPQERRRPVLGSNIHIGMLVEKRTHPLQVLIFHGVDEPQILVGGRCADNHEQGQGERPHDAVSSAPV